MKLEDSTKNKIKFVLPAVILFVFTVIWYIPGDRWYHYREEWLYTPLSILHFLMPLFYGMAFFVFLVRQIDRSTRSNDNLFYLITSIILSITRTIGLFIFLIMTCGR